jgi:hypothetical protein
MGGADMTGTTTGAGRADELNPTFGGRSVAVDGAPTLVVTLVGHSACVTG